MDTRPPSQAFANDSSALAVDGSADDGRDLLRVCVGNASLDQRMGGDAIDRRRQNDVGAGIPLQIGIYHKQVNVAMEGGGWDRLDLVDVKVTVDVVGSVLATRVIGEDTSSRLRRCNEYTLSARKERRLTVWMRMGKSPTLLCLFLRPLKITRVSGSSSASA